MISLFSVGLFYVFTIGMTFAADNSFTHSLYNFVYLAFVLLVFELSLARLLYRALHSQQDLAVLAGFFILVSGHIFAYTRHLRSEEKSQNDFGTLARSLEYMAQLIMMTNVMKFTDEIHFKVKIDTINK